MSKYPAKDQIAIVGIGRSEYGRDLHGRSYGSLVLEAAKAALADAGLAVQEVDGICGAGQPVGATAPYVASALGIDGLAYWDNPGPVHGFSIASACNAIFAGQCSVALVYHSVFRNPARSRSAVNDPFRVRTLEISRGIRGPIYPEATMGVSGYAAWTSRYFHEYGLRRDQLGRIALNDRSNAARNPHAVMREPLTMDDYLSARFVREPLCIFDMDLPIDGANALILTTRDRARDLRKKAVLVHALTFGMTRHPQEDQLLDLRHTGQQVAMSAIWERSDLSLNDIDVFFPYDGFSIIALNWIENAGYCAKGEAGSFVETHWDADSGSIRIDGRIAVNPHGGSLSEGGTQGAGHIREAIVQLRGDAEDRQVPDATAALVTPGGFFFNSQALLLRADI